MVKKTVNQDDPTVYHLFYADEQGSPGADLTFFEYPGAAAGRPGPGQVHRIVWRVGSPEAIDFWARRLGRTASAPSASTAACASPTPRASTTSCASPTSRDAPLSAEHPEIPREHALQGFDGVRAYAFDPARSEALLRETLGFTGGEDGRWEVRGDERGGFYAYDPAPGGRGSQGAGSVHHIAFATQMDEQDAWRERVAHPATPTRPR